MNTLDQLIEPLKHSPQLPLALKKLQQVLTEEMQRREQFLDETNSNQKAEFIDGKVIIHSPARNIHLDVTLRIATLLRTFSILRQIGQVKVEKCLCVFARNAYEPDIVFFGNDKSRNYTAETRTFPEPDLIVEVLSESTQINDRGVKFDDFAASGVREYWVVDADHSFIEQYILSDGKYELKLKSSRGPIESEVIAGFATQVEAFFDEDANLHELWKLKDS